MTQLHLQKTTELRNKPERTAVVRCLIAILITVLLALGFKSAYGHRLDEQPSDLATNTPVAEQHSPAQSLDNYQHLIGELRKAQAQQVNTGVWLRSVNNQGQVVAIEGTATSPAAVADVISNLQDTGYFSNIEIKETYQDDSKNKTQVFKFQLTCEIAASNPKL
jgi:Tfp pilus assembly protein PilN